MRKFLDRLFGIEEPTAQDAYVRMALAQHIVSQATGKLLFNTNCPFSELVKKNGVESRVLLGTRRDN